MSFQKKSVKNKGFRKRVHRESSDEEEDPGSLVEVTKEMQKIRKKASGLSAVALAIGTEVSNEQKALMDSDPFKLTTGGLIDMKKVKDRNRDRTYEDVDRDVTNLGTTFSAETNRRDEDAELTTYIEREIRRRKGLETSDGDVTKNIKSAEDQLFQLPEHLKIAVKKQSEEMLSNQMLSGIPEIDLGVEVKIKNIERTEEAKQRLIQERLDKKSSNTGASFVPSNMAVNFARPVFGKDKKDQIVKDVRKKPTEMGNKKNKDKPSDDYHYDKFRRQMRK